MKSTLYATREYFHRYGSRIVAFAMSVAIVTLLSLAFTTLASAQTYNSSSGSGSSSSSGSSASIISGSGGMIAGTADLGSRGANVTAIQTFLAANPQFYPEGLVTGYFGSLTAAAVRRFQVFYGIVTSGTPSTTGFGRVGPSTMSKMNSLIASGGGTGTPGTTGADVSGPALFNVNHSQSTNSVTFTLNTNENALVRVAYNTNPLMFNEGDMNSNGFGPIGGLSVNSPTGMSTSHSITVSNLNANTTYYFTVIATDAAGNVSVWGPNNAIRTNP